MQPIGKQLFGVADEKINFSRADGAARDKSDSDVVELTLDDDFRTDKRVKCSRHELTDEDVFGDRLRCSDFLSPQVYCNNFF